jgi:hypothetical protein
MVIAIYAIYEVRPPLDHTLVNQFLEWFFLAAYTIIKEELIPEA